MQTWPKLVPQSGHAFCSEVAVYIPDAFSSALKLSTFERKNQHNDCEENKFCKQHGSTEAALSFGPLNISCRRLELFGYTLKNWCCAPVQGTQLCAILYSRVVSISNGDVFVSFPMAG